jgi:hypothetical protein
MTHKSFLFPLNYLRYIEARYTQCRPLINEKMVPERRKKTFLKYAQLFGGIESTWSQILHVPGRPLSHTTIHKCGHCI